MKYEVRIKNNRVCQQIYKELSGLVISTVETNKKVLKQWGKNTDKQFCKHLTNNKIFSKISISLCQYEPAKFSMYQYSLCKYEPLHAVFPDVELMATSVQGCTEQY